MVSEMKTRSGTRKTQKVRPSGIQGSCRMNHFGEGINEEGVHWYLVLYQSSNKLAQASLITFGK